jgi:large subunit ribosomal protein L24
MRIRRGDTVEVISGTDKGIRGEVIRVIPDEDRIVVQGANMRTKHQRQVQTGGRTMSPGIIQFEGPVHVSNVMVVCPKCDQLSRISITRDDGERKRFCKSCQAALD